MTSRFLKWRRPLGFMETVFYKNKVGISALLRLSTSRELTERDVTKGLVSLHKITPNLRMVVRERDNHLWMTEMTHDNINFKVLENTDPHAAVHNMVVPSYHEEGPYWAARYLPWSSVQQDYFKSAKVETKQQHPYISHLVLSFHHCITDGFSNVRIFRTLLGLLDDVLANKNIDDHTQLAEFIDTKHEKLVLEKIERDFLEYPLKLERTKQSFSDFITETMICKAYSVPKNVKPATFSLPYSLDRETTKKFITRCKSEKVTFHTAFCSVTDAAIVKFLLDSNIERPHYQISSRHAVDHRQYFKDCTSFGLGMGSFDMMSDTPKDILKQFWPHAKQYHAKFKLQQTQMASFQYHVMHKLTGIDPISRLQKADPPKTGFHYITTNLLDITSTLGDCGTHIALEHLDGISSIQSLPVYWISTIHTFRGQLMHSFMYNAHFMTCEVAQKIAGNIHDIFGKVTDTK